MGVDWVDDAVEDFEVIISRVKVRYGFRTMTAPNA